MQIHMQQPASEDEITLYCLIGGALCAIQQLEDALSHSIALKKDIKIPVSITRKDGDQILSKYRAFTLGKAIKLTNKEKLYPENLQNELEAFVLERNWLVHKCMPENRDDLYTVSGKSNLFRRIKATGTKAGHLQQSVEVDMIKYSQSKGLDMSHVIQLFQLANQ